MADNARIALDNFKMAQKVWKAKVEAGEATKDEAISMILTAALRVFEELKLPEPMDSIEQEQAYQGAQNN